MAKKQFKYKASDKKFVFISIKKQLKYIANKI